MDIDPRTNPSLPNDDPKVKPSGCGCDDPGHGHDEAEEAGQAAKRHNPPQGHKDNDTADADREASEPPGYVRSDTTG
jgi:hypothetical protein